MASVGVDHCVISVSDWDRSNEFYRDVVGADLIQHGDGRWAYQFGAQQLNVHGPGVADSPLRPKVRVQPGNSHVCLVWEGPIDRAVEHLRSHGVAIEEGPVERRGADGTGTSVYFRDPDGSLLEFISYD